MPLSWQVTGCRAYLEAAKDAEGEDGFRPSDELARDMLGYYDTAPCLYIVCILVIYGLYLIHSDYG